jgi:hypothetical protein
MALPRRKGCAVVDFVNESGANTLKVGCAKRLQKYCRFCLKMMRLHNCSRVARFSLVQHTKMGKYTKVRQNAPNVSKIPIQHLPLEDPQKFII